MTCTQRAGARGLSKARSVRAIRRICGPCNIASPSRAQVALAGCQARHGNAALSENHHELHVDGSSSASPSKRSVTSVYEVTSYTSHHLFQTYSACTDQPCWPTSSYIRPVWVVPCLAAASNATIGELTRPDRSNISTPTKCRLPSVSSKIRHCDSRILGNSDVGRGLQMDIMASDAKKLRRRHEQVPTCSRTKHGESAEVSDTNQPASSGAVR